MDYTKALQAEGISDIKRYFQAPVLDSTHLTKFKKDIAAWGFLTRLDGSVFSLLAAQTQVAVVYALHDLTDLPTLDIQKLYDGQHMSLDEACHTLQALRYGQPTPRLMERLSPTVATAIQYLRSVVERKHNVIKLIVGDPGMGKSTFRDMFVQKIMDIPYAVAVKHNVAGASTFKPCQFITGLITDDSVLIAVNARLKELLRENTEESRAILKRVIASPMYPVLEVLSRLNEDELPAFLRAVSSWSKEPQSRITPINSFCKSRVPAAPATPEMAMAYAAEWLRIYKLLNVYPLFLLDEFESLRLLNNGTYGKTGAQALIRELFDLVCAPESTGALFIFTTEDGLNFMAEYPALADRISGSATHGLQNIKWYMTTFNAWSAKHTLDVLTHMYQRSTELLPENVQVLRHLSMADPLVVKQLHDIAAAPIEPRKKLKSILAILDSFSTVDGYTAHLDVLLAEAEQLQLMEEQKRAETARLIEEKIAREALREQAREEQARAAAMAATRPEPEPAPEPDSDTDEDSDVVDQLLLADLLAGIHVIHYSKPKHYSSDEDSITSFNKTMASISKNTGAMLGKRIATWRERNSYKALPSDIKRKIQLFMDNLDVSATFEDCITDLQLELDGFVNAEQIIRVRGPEATYNSINPVENLCVLRNYAYQFCIQRGCLPTDVEIDAAVLELAKSLFDIRTQPARIGLRFATSGFRSILTPYEMLANTDLHPAY